MCATAVPVIATLGLPAAIGARVSSDWGGTVLPAGSRTDSAPEVLLIGDVDDDALVHCVRPETIAVLQWDEEVPPEGGRGPTPTSGVAGFRVSVLTETVFEKPVASMIRHGLQARIELDDDRAYDLETAVHEALVNGALHGNLGFGSVAEQDQEALAWLHERLTELLADGAGKRKRIEVDILIDGGTVSVTVSDAGQGFDVQATLERLRAKPADASQPAGRGLLIMNSMADDLSFRKGGRLVAIRFGS